MAANAPLPSGGNLFISVKDPDKDSAVEIAKDFHDLGFVLYSTSGTAARIEEAGIPVNKLHKLAQGRPNVLDMIKNGEIALVVNTPSGRTPRRDEVRIRSGALSGHVPILTTLSAARASLNAIRSQNENKLGVTPLQDFHPE